MFIVTLGCKMDDHWEVQFKVEPGLECGALFPIGHSKLAFTKDGPGHGSVSGREELFPSPPIPSHSCSAVWGQGVQRGEQGSHEGIAKECRSLPVAMPFSLLQSCTNKRDIYSTTFAIKEHRVHSS